MSKVRVDPPDLPNLKEAGSWVSVVQNKQVLKKYDVNISTSDGQNSVEIPDEILQNSTPLWEDFLVGKFLETAPHVAKVHVIVNKIWKLGTDQKIDVYEVNPTTLRFRVRNPLVRARILRRGMWNIAEVPMVVSKWSPTTEKEQPEEKSIPLWVYLKNVPMNMFSWEGLSFITSAVGHPLHLHPETAACSSFDVAKIFVNVDLSKPLPKRIRFGKEGFEFWVDFLYPWLPPRCSICEKWGHLDSRCVVVEKEETVLISDTMIVSPKEKTVEDAEEWSQVSPSKASRSPFGKANLQDRSQPITTTSQFAVLSVDEEEGEIVEKDDNVEGKTEAGKAVVQTKTGDTKGEAETKVGGRAPLSRNAKKKMNGTSETSAHGTKDTILGTSSKKSSRRNL
ncbi:unnamed protein product [Arabidopsis arenosa]|uniref:DUF4283 domain-containing protein n=1 Tax=Arabidopsis arenosa TaxID=38785 RepID=A0A8S2AX30_ARAAE|nr:unnamed protein product [Arabidopsis arenosa]